MEKIAVLTAQNPGIKVEKHYLREQWVILAGDGESSVKELAKEYNIESLREYIFRSQREINGSFCCGQAMEHTEH